MELNSKNIKKIIFVIFCAALIFAAILNISNVWLFISKVLAVFSPIITALCVAFVLNVLLIALETKVFAFMDKSRKKFINKLKRPLCLTLTYLIAFGIVSVVILVVIPDIIDTLTYLAEKMPSFIVNARNWIEGLLLNFNIKESTLPDIKIDWASIFERLKNFLSGYSTKLFGDAINITTSFFSGIFDTVFSIVISIYVLAQKEKIGSFVKKVINRFIPEKPAGKLYHISYEAAYSFSRFIGGQVIEACILAILCFIGMLIFRFPNAPIISILVGLTSLVPVVGPFVGALIGFLLIVITNPLKAFLFVIFFIILQQLEGNLIYPRVVGKAVGLPSVIVISAVLVGGNIGGVMGTLLAVPISAVLFTLLKEAISTSKTNKIPVQSQPITAPKKQKKEKQK